MRAFTLVDLAVCEWCFKLVLSEHATLVSNNREEFLTCPYCVEEARAALE